MGALHAVCVYLLHQRYGNGGPKASELRVA